jgi:hypothetical protein
MSIRQLFIKAKHLLFPLVLLLLLMGCVTVGDDIPADEVETPMPVESAVTPSETPKASVTPRATYTPDVADPVTTPTATLLRATLTPMPTATLTIEEKTENLAELMRTNGGCELPCWWGIVQGETQFEMAWQDLLEKGFQLGDDNHARIRVGDVVISTGFEIEEGVVRSIDVKSSKLPATSGSSAFEYSWQRYTLAEVLNRYRLPPQVLVYSPFRADPGGGPSYHLLVFYDDLGFEIEYTGSAEQLNGNYYRACPDLADIWDIGLFLYQPGRVDNVMERVLPSDSIDYIAGPETVYDLISWEHATGTELVSFYETFSAPGDDACFEYTTYWP